jgi:hypothetical protein
MNIGALARLTSHLIGLSQTQRAAMQTSGNQEDQHAQNNTSSVEIQLEASRGIRMAQQAILEASLDISA